MPIDFIVHLVALGSKENKTHYCPETHAGNGESKALTELKSIHSLFDRTHQHIDCFLQGLKSPRSPDIKISQATQETSALNKAWRWQC